MDYTLPEFLAHAIALESEAADCYLELSDMMQARGNRQLAALFRDMVHFCRLHRDDIAQRAGDLALLKPHSWEYRWSAPGEVGAETTYEHLVQPNNALRYARENEVRAMQYYSTVGQQASDPEVRRLASEFASEEAEHVDALDDWIAHVSRAPAAPGAVPEPFRRLEPGGEPLV